ncbi:MAG TPA: hypothetical protein VFF06_09550 [Polyangia bacterium]|nr:hypothetical protein [Polyangia bacterium]
MNRDDDDAPIDRQKLEAAWPAPEPPADFAARAAAAWKREQSSAQPAPRRRIGAARAVLVLLPLAAAAIFLWWPRAPEAGARVVTSRESITLGARGVAVAEAGAALAWRVDGRAALITQDAGSVFYRVERGGPFIVRTAAGEVRVQGTCFRVEVDPMGLSKKGLVQMGAGAALATTVLVTVYEGKVLFANEHGKTALAAGEHASARGDSAPGAAQSSTAPQVSAIDRAALSPPPEGMTRDELLARDRQQRAEIERLRASLKHAEESADPNASDRMDGSKTPFYAPSKDELQQLAKDCKLKWDAPHVGVEPQTLDKKLAAELGLSDQDRAAYDRVSADMNARVTAQLRALYVELTGDKTGADTLTPHALEAEIYAKSRQKDLRDVYYRMSRERAGLMPPPADVSSAQPIERMQRLMSGLGDTFEADLAQAIGPDHAHALRNQHGGWSSRSVSSYGCPE